MFSDGPPSRDEITTSRTCPESVEVKILTSSGISAPASVPQVMIMESFHQSVESPPRLGIMKYDRRKVIAIDTKEVSHTSVVRGDSKFIFAAFSYLAFAIQPLME